MQTNNSTLPGKEYPKWLFILLPAVTMLLGWGLRGFIGGGPFGAMIPGAMLMITISLLLKLPLATAAVVTVFGTASIGMGGEMTYGQTLGFLRNADTVWWGTVGTTVKGGVWGLVGGSLIGMGLLYKKINPQTIVTAFLLFLLAFLIGLKLINDPKLVYFSDPINKPRQESWAGLLFAAIALLVYLKCKITAAEFSLIFRFAIYGLVGGAIGFGLGGFWLVLGFRLGKNTLITEWWKLMEFSFGFIMGGFFGYASWLSRNALKEHVSISPQRSADFSILQQLVAITVIGAVIYLVIPLAEPFVEERIASDGFGFEVLRTVARILVNYTFIGLMLTVVALRWPFLAFQMTVTLTFSHTMIDLVEDLDPGYSNLIRAGLVVASSLCVAFLVAVYQRKPKVLQSMFFILVWSTVFVAIARMFAARQFQVPEGHSVLKFVIGDMMVFNFFMASAVVVSVWVAKPPPALSYSNVT